MIEWFGGQVDAALGTYVSATVSKVMGYVAPIASAAMSLWILNYAYAVVRGEVPEPVPTFAWKMVKNSIIVAVATGLGIYQAVVVGGINSLTTDMIVMFAPPDTPLGNIKDVWGAIAGFDTAASDLVVKVAKDGIFSLEALVSIAAMIMFCIGNCVFESVAVYTAVFVRVMTCFTLAVGPVFILCLLFKATTQYFFSWLGALLSLVVLAWVAFFVLGFSLSMSTQIAAAAVNNLGALNILSQSLAYMVICLVLALLVYQAPTFAAGLTGGSPAQLGAALATQLYTAYRVGHPARSTASGGSNTVQPRAGLAYRAGAAAAGVTGARWVYQQIAARGRSRP